MMYRQRDKTVSRAPSLWSVLKYDIGTAIDVLGLPCLARLSEIDVSKIFHDVRKSRITEECRVKFERKVSFFNVRARVCELNDIDWFSWCKGEEFVVRHRQLVGTEFFIPLHYKGKVRIADRTENRDYFSITEVINDFPKFVRVMKDTACFSPGDINYHVVHKGSVLELDRVTRNNRTVGGPRHNFLICFDKNDGREIAFRVMSPVHFQKVHDDTKYTVKDFIEHVPMPKKVEFLNINPYDVIVADDRIASDILHMLSGPVELLEPKKCEYLIGRIQNPETGEINTLALPTESEALEHFLVYIPSTTIIKNEKDYADTVITGQTDCDIIQQKLFTYSTDSTLPLLLKCDSSPFCFYDVTEPPDTPPLPPKYDYATLRSTLSEQHVAGSDCEDDTITICRRRFFSTGDLKTNKSQSSLGSVDRETRGIKGYLSHLSHRFKSSASQIVFGMERRPSFKDRSRSSSPRKTLIRNFLSQRLSPVTDASFVCYLNCANDDELSTSNEVSLPETSNARDNVDSMKDIVGEPTNNNNEHSANHLSTNIIASDSSNQTTGNKFSTNCVAPNASNQSSEAHISTNNMTGNSTNQIPGNSTNQITEICSVASNSTNQPTGNPHEGCASAKTSLNCSSEEVIYSTVKKVTKKEIRTKNYEKEFLCETCRELFDQSSFTEE